MHPTASPDLALTPYVNLTTYRRDGRPVTTPVWIIAHGERFYVGTTRDTGKYKRLRFDPRVRVVACDHRGRGAFGPSWEGTAREVADGALRAAVQQGMTRKYGRLLFAFIMLLYRLRGRYRLRTVLELDLHPAP